MPFDPNQPYEVVAPESPPVRQQAAPREQSVAMVDQPLPLGPAYKFANTAADLATRFPLVEAGAAALKWGAQNLPSPINYFKSDEQKQAAQQRLENIPTSMPRFNPFAEKSVTLRDVLESRGTTPNVLYENVVAPAAQSVADTVKSGYDFVRRLEPERLMPTPTSGLPRMRSSQVPETMRELLGEPFPKDIPTITSEKMFNRLKKGTWFRDSSGELKKKL